MFCRKTGGPRAKNGQKVTEVHLKWDILQENRGPRAGKGQKMTEVCPKWDVLQENWGTSGRKRAKSDRGVPEMGCFAGKLGDLGHEMDEKRPRCARGGG